MAESDIFLQIGDKVCLQEDQANGLCGSSGFSTSQLGVRLPYVGRENDSVSENDVARATTADRTRDLQNPQHCARPP